MGWVWIEMYFLHTRTCVLCQSIGSRKSNQNSSSFYGFLETLGTRFCSICFCFVFPRSLFVVLVIIIIFLYPFQCVGGVGGSLWIMMIRPQTRLFSIPVDSYQSVYPYSYASIHPSSNPSPSHGGLIIDLLSAFWVCVAQVNGKEIVTDTQNGQHTEMYLGLCFLYLRRPCRYIFEAHASAFLMLLSSI